MTWFGWLLVIWWGVSLLASMFVAGRGGIIGKNFKQTVGSLLFGSFLNFLFIALVLTVGTGYGL